MSGSGAPKDLIFWAAWWAGRNHQQLRDRSARLMAAVKISGDAAAGLDVLALPQLACFARMSLPASAVLHQPPPPQIGTYLLPELFLHPSGARRGPHFFPGKIDLSLCAPAKTSSAEPQAASTSRSSTSTTSSTTALPNFATTTYPSHRQQSWRPLTCPAFSTPPARTLSCSWPPSPTSAPRTCRFT